MLFQLKIENQEKLAGILAWHQNPWGIKNKNT